MCGPSLWHTSLQEQQPTVTEAKTGYLTSNDGVRLYYAKVGSDSNAVERQRMVGNPINAGLVLSPCETQNEWPTHLWPHFESLLTSDQALDIAKEAIAKVTAPVLTIHGKKDRNAPYGGGREWDMLLPNARLITIDGAAHMSWVEFPEIVFPGMDLFLNGQWPEQAETVKSLGSKPGICGLTK